MTRIPLSRPLNIDSPVLMVMLGVPDSAAILILRSAEVHLVVLAFTDLAPYLLAPFEPAKLLDRFGLTAT